MPKLQRLQITVPEYRLMTVAIVLTYTQTTPVDCHCRDCDALQRVIVRSLWEARNADHG